MAKRKLKFMVYYRHYFATDYPEVYGTRNENGIDLDEWKEAGETWAVSEAQAINNVRCRLFGFKSSQYKPFAYNGSYEEGYDWKAVVA